MTRRFLLPAALSLFFLAPRAGAMDFWQYPEAADRNSIVAGGFAASLSFSLPDVRSFRFAFGFPEIFVDYVLPVGLPFSFGASVKPVESGKFGVGLRPAYHLNLNMPALDVYLAYPVTLDFSEDEFALLQYGGALGFRWNALSVLWLCVETGWRLRGVSIGVAVKLI